uniref:Uncharacterized protein n=1 Tax=Hyaloperonospora arabidopsidis (strain Emoy2) TaxID=559515 RepID=M4BJ07_HYAAE
MFFMLIVLNNGYSIDRCVLSIEWRSLVMIRRVLLYDGFCSRVCCCVLISSSGTEHVYKLVKTVVATYYLWINIYLRWRCGYEMSSLNSEIDLKALYANQKTADTYKLYRWIYCANIVVNTLVNFFNMWLDPSFQRNRQL